MKNTQHRYALKPGYQIHWYKIESIIGTGGFGITYLARDINLDMPVAIKEYLPTGFAMRDTDDSIHPVTEETSPKYTWGLDRFIKEARVLSLFKHPNIVQVQAVFEQNNTGYMVMAYEDGRSLKELLKAGPRLCQEALLDIFLPLIDVLELVHQKGFIHRDIKPDNIYIRNDGSPVLLDFGSARQTTHNQDFTILLSPGYSPSEQYSVDCDRQGPWTDIYSLGSTLYFAITGQKLPDALKCEKNFLKTGIPLEKSALKMGQGRYSPGFLAAIDHAIHPLSSARPQCLAQWRKELLQNTISPSAIAAVSMALSSSVNRSDETLVDSQSIVRDINCDTSEPTLEPKPESAPGLEQHSANPVISPTSFKKKRTSKVAVVVTLMLSVLVVLGLYGNQLAELQQFSSIRLSLSLPHLLEANTTITDTVPDAASKHAAPLIPDNASTDDVASKAEGANSFNLAEIASLVSEQPAQESWKEIIQGSSFQISEGMFNNLVLLRRWVLTGSGYCEEKNRHILFDREAQFLGYLPDPSTTSSTQARLNEKRAQLAQLKRVNQWAEGSTKRAGYPFALSCNQPYADLHVALDRLTGSTENTKLWGKWDGIRIGTKTDKVPLYEALEKMYTHYYERQEISLSPKVLSMLTGNILIESGARQNAHSKSNAKGIMQLSPYTLKDCGLAERYHYHRMAQLECALKALDKNHRLLRPTFTKVFGGLPENKSEELYSYLLIQAYHSGVNRVRALLENTPDNEAAKFFAQHHAQFSAGDIALGMVYHNLGHNRLGLGSLYFIADISIAKAVACQQLPSVPGCSG